MKKLLIISVFSIACHSKPNGVIYIFGDSVADGYGLSHKSDRWSTLLCETLNMKEINNNVWGSTLEKQIPVNPFGSSNLIDRLNRIPKRSYGDKWLIISYGQNDAAANFSAYDTSNFKADYRKVIRKCFDMDWPPDSILLVSPPYISSEGFKCYVMYQKTKMITAERYFTFVDAVANIASEYHTRFADIYTPLSKENFTSTDQVHQNYKGHKVIADVVEVSLGYISPPINRP